MLNRARLGFEEMTKEDIDLLMSRCVEGTTVEHGYLHAYYSNADVANYNMQMLNKLEKPLYQIKGTIKAPLGLMSRVRNSIKEDGRVGGTGFLDVLNIKVGARVTLIYNVWTSDGLVNGAMGTIVGINMNKENSTVDFIAVAFDNQRAGTNQRLKYQYYADRYSKVNGTPIFKHEMEFDLSKRTTSSAKGTIHQFPLMLAWASTAHRLQVTFCIT